MKFQRCLTLLFMAIVGCMLSACQSDKIGDLITQRWKLTTFDRKPWHGYCKSEPALRVDDKIFVVSGYGWKDESWLHILDYETGELKKRFGPSGYTFSSLSSGDGVVLYNTLQGARKAPLNPKKSTHAISAESASLLWEKPGLSNSVIHSSRVWGVAPAEGNKKQLLLGEYELKTGELLKSLPAPLWEKQPIATGKYLVSYITDKTRTKWQVFVFDPNTTSLKSRAHSSKLFLSKSDPAIDVLYADDHVAVVRRRDNLKAVVVSLEDMSILKSLDGVKGISQIAQNRLLIKDKHGTYRIFDRDTFKQVEEFSLGRHTVSDQLRQNDVMMGEHLILPSQSYLYRVLPNGSQKTRLFSSTGQLSPPLITNTSVVVSSDNCSIYRFDMR